MLVKKTLVTFRKCWFWFCFSLICEHGIHFFPLWWLHQQPVWQWLSTQQSCLTCQPQGSYLRSCCISAYLLLFIISFITIVCFLVFQNIIIEEKNFYVFTIFRGSYYFGVLCPEAFDAYCQLANYSWATIFPWLSLPSYGFNYFPMELMIPIFWNIIFNFFSYSDVTMAIWLDQKVLLLPITIPI